MTQDWVPAVSVVSGAILGIAGVAFGYLNSYQERRDRRLSAEREFRESRITLVDSRAFEQRSKTYEDALLSIGLMAILIDPWLPSLDDLIDDHGERTARLTADSFLSGSDSGSLVTLQGIARLAAAVAAFGSRAASDLIEDYLKKWTEALARVMPVAEDLGLDFALSNSELERDDSDSSISWMRPSFSLRDFLEVAVLIDEITYTSTILRSEASIMSDDHDDDDMSLRRYAISQWSPEAVTIGLIWDVIRDATSHGMFVQEFTDLRSGGVYVASDDSNSHGVRLTLPSQPDLRGRATRGAHLVQAGPWFAENREEWILARSRRGRRESLGAIVPSDILDFVDEAGERKRELNALVRDIRETVRSELLPTDLFDLAAES